ncbi:hypothetical protein [Streptomyces demainii]|uniref:Uncharacterized protein n=1 Tax=Streptomyces demainii TaxID=588122 RepID=A0ABT9KXF8_9ACTN|nr:hypothetical protein [Streptomyces demainii]MDP9613107.1 hypothetical protein [Streptomyces demainii]
MDAAMVGLVGTVLGGLIGAGGALGQTRVSGRDQRRNQELHWRRQMRRDAYAQLLSKATAALVAGADATDAVEDEDLDHSGKAERFRTAVTDLEYVVALVSLEGPEDASRLAWELAQEFRHWSNCLELYVGINEGYQAMTSPHEMWEYTLDHKNTSYEAVDEFPRKCQEWL